MTRYSISYSGKFKKDFRKYHSKPRELNAIKDVLKVLSENGVLGLTERMRPHKLSGRYSGYWECHILPDLLIIWLQVEDPAKEIYLVRIGSHSDLF